MDLDDALGVLGLRRDTTWAEVRATYRARIRSVHPDVSRGSGSEAARLNAAFSALEPVYRRGHPPAPGRAAVAASDGRHRAPDPDPDPRPPRDESLVMADDGLVLEAPADEVVMRLAEAIDEVGALTYVDATSGYLEGLVGDGTAQLVVSLRVHAYATDASFTLEQLGAQPAPPIETVVRQIASHLRSRRAV